MFISYATSALLATAFLTLILLYLINFVGKVRQLPAGPWGLPVIGYLPWITKKPHETFIKLGKKYGGFFSINLGGETVLVLNDWTTIKKTLVEQPNFFNGRPDKVAMNAFTGRKDLSFSDGPIWKLQRNLTVKCLRGCGMTTNAMNDHFAVLVNELIDKFNQLDNQDVEVEWFFFGPMLKALWTKISSYEIVDKDGHLGDFEDIITSITKSLRADSPVNTFPWLRFLPMDLFGYWSFVKLNSQLLEILQSAIEHQSNNWSEKDSHTFIDQYMKIINKKKADSIYEPPYNEQHLLGTIHNLFGAAIDTVGVATLWGFLVLVLNPDIQTKVQNELDSVIGGERLPNVHDFSSLPYLDAFVKEVHRYSSVIPMALMHRTTANVNVNGYVIPPNTTCIQNIYAVHHDPQLWDEPNVFKPERFLDKDNQVISPPYLMPFSIGPRLCVGQLMAEMELRMVFSCLLHKFTFSVPKNSPKPTMETELRISLLPKPYSLFVQSRNR